MYIGLHVKHQLFLLYFNETWISSTDYLNNTQTPNFMQIRPVGAKSSHAGGYKDGRTDIHDEGNSLFFLILRTHLKLLLPPHSKPPWLHYKDEPFNAVPSKGSTGHTNTLRGQNCTCNATSDGTYKYTYQFAWQGHRPNEIDRKYHFGIVFRTSLHVVPCHRRRAGHISWFWCAAVHSGQFSL
jgi:hypothetical protein